MVKKKFVYKNIESMNKMHAFYDETLASLNVTYAESYINTSFGKTHSLLVGDPDKPKICTIHGGNGITPLNLKLFLPLLNDFSIIAPDVVGMPGKSAPYRNISSAKDEYGLWIKEVLDHYKADKISFAVSSYSSAMFLSFAKRYPQMVDKALLLVPSGIAHGPIMPMIGKMVVPFIKYYFHPTEKGLNGVIRCMGGNCDEIWRRFFDLMMSGYKMEMRPPREYKKEELKCIKSPLLIIASDNDIFFPADNVFKRAREIFDCSMHFVKIKSKHLPSEKVMTKVCSKTTEFFLNSHSEKEKPEPANDVLLQDVKVLAACGNDCAACPRYIAHPYEKTEEELHYTAKLWHKIGYRDRIVTNEEISCTGCKPENWCRYHVVKCCEGRGIKTCAECEEYPCANMKECFEVTKSFEPMCKKVCTEEEYRQLKRAFFEKEKNLSRLII